MRLLILALALSASCIDGAWQKPVFTYEQHLKPNEIVLVVTPNFDTTVVRTSELYQCEQGDR